jgi:hypothetical protein
MVLDPANGVAKGEGGRLLLQYVQSAFSCCDAILETGPAVSTRSELLVTHEKLGQLPLLTVYVVPV